MLHTAFMYILDIYWHGFIITVYVRGEWLLEIKIKVAQNQREKE